MKADHPRITLLGSNSGRNLGDAAILASILDILTKELPDAEFYVPTTHPGFIREAFGDKYNVYAIDVMPWTGSVRLFGIPTMRCIAKSDLALICDGIIFGKKFFNPAFNMLNQLVFLAPWAKLCGCKLACYSCGIGPFPGFWGKIGARYVMNSCDLMTLREEDSKRLAEELGVTKEITITGDAAFLNLVSSEQRAKQIAHTESINLEAPILGINVTRYIDAWLAKSERIADKAAFLEMLAASINAAKQSIDQQLQPVVFCTHPMDEEFCTKLSSLTNGMLISGTRYSSHDLQSIMQHCGLFMGMRFHSVVLASAVNCPVIGLIYAPKVRGYMRLLQAEQYGLELAQLTSDDLASKLAQAWEIRDQLKEQQLLVVDNLKQGATQAAATIREQFFPGYQANTATRAVVNT